MEMRMVAYLLASLLAERRGTTAERELAFAREYAEASIKEESESQEIRKMKEAMLQEDIDEIYKAYPTSDPASGRSLGKCAKDKTRIRTMLKTQKKERILLAISQYIEGCRDNNIFLKNFSTFLNNMPEPSEEEIFEAEPKNELDELKAQFR